MSRIGFITTEEKQYTSILVIDKKGLLGKELALRLSSDFSITFVSSQILTEPNTQTVTYKKDSKRLPSIPDQKYAYIFLVWEGEKELLYAFSQINHFALLHDTILVALVPYWINREKLEEKVVDLGKNGKLFIHGELFGETVPFSEKGIANQFLKQATKTNHIQVPENGLSITYPVCIKDVIQEVVESIFGNRKLKTIGLLVPRFPPTLLSLAHAIQKVMPEVKVDFAPKQKYKMKEYSFVGEHLLEENYSYPQKFKKTLEFAPQDQQEEKNISSHTFSIQKNMLFSLLLGILIAIFLPLLLTVVFSLVGVREIAQAKTFFENGQFSKAKNSIVYSREFFSLASLGGPLLFWEAKLFRQEEAVQGLINKVETGKEVTSSIIAAFDSIELFRSVIEGKSVSPKKDVNLALDTFKTSLVYFQKIEAEGMTPSDLQKKTATLKKPLQLLSGIVDTIPVVLGIDSTRKYLILFQNNMELRPGGGFIGSYGLLTIHKGKFMDFTIHDVYDADGKLQGHIEPPFPLKRYMGVKHWFLRDSNFDVEFIPSASKAAFFLEQETGERVDGVIGVDLSFVKGLLHITGPVYVPDYNESVTSENLFELAESHAELNFFPGSTAKKDFLQALFLELQSKFVSNPRIQLLPLFEQMQKAIVEKHILFAFNDPFVQEVFALQGASSRLPILTPMNEKVLNGIIGFNEANIGGNKANFFIKRKVSHVVYVQTNGVVKEVLSLTYTNTSKNGVWPGGEYKNYIRFLLPKDVQIGALEIDAKKQATVSAILDPKMYEAKKFKPPTGIEIDKEQRKTIDLYGFLLPIPENSSKTLTLVYFHTKKLDMTLPVLHLSWYIYKQPGIDEIPFTQTIFFPQEYRFISEENPAKTTNTIVMKKIVTEDEKETVILSKK